MSAAPRVRTLLGGIFAVVLVVPILAIGLGRIYENQLVRQTEESLIAEAVVVGEVYRLVSDPSAAGRPLAPLEDPSAERYHPFLPLLDLRTSPVLPPVERPEPDGATRTIAHALGPLLERARVRNLSALRVLDPSGTVVASPTTPLGYRLSHLEEVQAALRGEYGAALRRRETKAHAPLAGISRAAMIRVSIAIPIYADPRAPAGAHTPIVGVVYGSRTPLDVGQSLWRLRDELYWPAFLSLAVTLAIGLALGAAIARPLVRLGRAAERVAKGERGVALEADGFAPAEVHALAEALARMRDQLEARAHYSRDFTAHAAHELKSPLTSLRGAAELLLESDSMSPEQARRFLENIHEDAVRMDRLVQRMLQLARIESQAPVREPIDLRAFLAAIAERYARRGHDVRVHYRASSDAVSMSPDLLESLAGNLLDNAVRHGAGHPVEVTVEDGPILTVRDHGPPMSDAQYAQLYTRFQTTERGRGGTGLGLAIVRAAAEAHGGSAEAIRHPDGASFVVRLTG